MKEYKKTIIRRMRLDEQLETFELLHISMPQVLDSMIRSLDRAMVRPDVTITPATIGVWQQVLIHLKAARGLYEPTSATNGHGE